MKKIKALYQKHREIILYVIFGGLTTVINYAIFVILLLFNVDIITTNIVSWIGAVLFAYLTNRSMVFNSQAKDKKAVLKEVLAFYGARVFSFIIETILLYVFVKLLFINEYISKLILQVVVIVLNYIFSKFFVFKKK